MRISDWSSDVCSPDLPYDRMGYLNENIINECPDVPSCSVLQRHFGKLTEAYRLAGIPYGRTELQRMGHERWKAKRAGETPRETITRRWPELARSEEHTSELQSLMRISYAVFCLKKKKKTQK